MPVDARTDIFSTGIILHEMLTTEKLFRGDTEFALMEKVNFLVNLQMMGIYNLRMEPLSAQ
jgi:serine/threonine protein kinase